MGCSSSLHTSNDSTTPYAVCIEISQSHPTTGQLTARQKQLVKFTWKIFADDMTGYGVQVFTYIFRIRPTIRSIFPFQDIPMASLPKDRRFRGHASRFMQAVGATVDNIDSLDRISSVFYDLGKQHCGINGFDPEYFNLFFEALMSVWKEKLEGRFVGDIETGWRSVFLFLLWKLRDGMGYPELKSIPETVSKQCNNT